MTTDNTEIPGQESVDATLASEGRALPESTDSSESGSLDPAEPTSTESAESGNPTGDVADSGPVTAPAGVPVKHRFRLIHQQHFGDNATAASTFTTAEHDADEFIQWAKAHRAELTPLARLLISLL